MGHPTIYPTGVTLYDPAKAWNGYTIFPAADLGALLIDMNGKEVQLWKGLQGFPNKLLPNGQVFGSTGLRAPDHSLQDQTDLVQVDWEGNIVWRFSRLEHIADPGQDPRWYARQHHDFQREGNPVGYYVPGQTPANDRGKTLLLVHADVHNPKISDQALLDDKLIEHCAIPVGLLSASYAPSWKLTSCPPIFVTLPTSIPTGRVSAWRGVADQS